MLTVPINNCSRSTTSSFRSKGKSTANLPCDPYLVHTNECVNIYHACEFKSATLIPCLHTSIMAKELRLGKVLNVNFSAGMVIAFISTQLDLMTSIMTSDSRINLDLCNMENDVILHIMFLRGKNMVFFNDHMDKSLLDGWGQQQSVKLSQVNVDRWNCLGVTISVHDCSTPSKEQYQILFDLTMMYYFNKRFPGPMININYSFYPSDSNFLLPEDEPLRILSKSLKVVTCNLDDLPIMQKQAIKSGGWVDSGGCFFSAHEWLVFSQWQLLL